jgi:predicted DNA binding CopG/RHH family protein
MKKRKNDMQLDAYEQEILDAFESGNITRPKNHKALMKEAKVAATNYFKKNARISIRLSEADLRAIKLKANMEGLPYQTLIASIIHKYAAGNLS